MKEIIRFLFVFYHLLFQSVNRTCRFSPTCSEYLVDATEKYGLTKGLYLGFKRVLSCHQFSKRPIYDPA